ncbi:mitochondrial ribosomal protein subunit L20-domain-containing protein [Microdochium bolleyi]|uniref:Mitochondrial ribosomal protein subunit L20-domain-containing protein n=1 Tax=Microdochium bolleyi TaxID=196109 RepID=A0A136J4D6_9PEZI|nr:mitochondrial ribosomal protein subunit L20-domain-containing protein [Microdochium bolleyi]
MRTRPPATASPQQLAVFDAHVAQEEISTASMHHHHFDSTIEALQATRPALRSTTPTHVHEADSSQHILHLQRPQFRFLSDCASINSGLHKQSALRTHIHTSPPASHMETRTMLRPLATTASHLCRQAVSTTPRRTQATLARTKRALKIPPHPSFLTPDAASTHIIYNPPAAAPSVFHTPFKFLPKSDPRRQANLTQLVRRRSSSDPLAASPPGDTSAASATAATLPPPLTRGEENRFKPRRNVTREQVDEMRALRAANPLKWSVLKLAEKYECTPIFVMMCCKASAEHQANERERKAAIRARWGPTRTQAREERTKRKALLLKGLL